MRRELPYRVLLPDSYFDGYKRFPVLFLLHGLFGSCENWLELTGLKEYVTGKDMIVVLPEGEDGWYTESDTAPDGKYESYLIDDLIPEIDNLYSTLPRKNKRAIAGLSMGGYGALKFGFKWPQLFCFAGSISGAFHAPRMTAENPGPGWEDLGPSVTKVFGKKDSETRRQNDLFRIIKQFPFGRIAELPYLYIDCGTDDSFLEINRKLAAALTEKGIAREYVEERGDHDWDYWDQRIRLLLPRIGELLKNR